jgi:hypothetical protein
VLTDTQRHVKAEVFDPLIRGRHVVEVGDLNVEVLDTSTDRVGGQPVHRGDGPPYSRCRPVLYDTALRMIAESADQ